MEQVVHLLEEPRELTWGRNQMLQDLWMEQEAQITLRILLLDYLHKVNFLLLNII